MTTNCENKLLPNVDIKSIYENNEKLKHDDYTHIIINDGKCLSNQKHVFLNLMNLTNQISLLIERIYHENYKLEHKDEKGNVAYHKYFMLDKSNIGKGIAKAIHDSELEIYKDKIDEIQLHAICDGIISWIRLGFSFVVADSKYLVFENFMNYLETIKKLNDSELDDIENLFLDGDGIVDENIFRKINKELYFSENSNFTTWFVNQYQFDNMSDEEDQKPTMKMYKEVS